MFKMTKGTIMSKNIDHALEEYGVEFIKNCIPDDIINRVREEYDRVDSTLNNSEIPKNKPIVVLWTHVKGAQKRIATFDCASMRPQYARFEHVKNQVKAMRNIVACVNIDCYRIY